MKGIPRRLGPAQRRFLLYLGLSLLMLLLPSAWTGAARHAALWPFTLAQRGTVRTTRAAVSVLRRIGAGGAPAEEVERLRKRVAALEAQLARETYLRRRAEARLEHFLGLPPEERARGLLASLAGYDPSPLRCRAVLDRGAADGVRRNCPVLWQGAVLGRVVSVGPASCTVALVGDPDCRIAVRSERTQAQGILQGLGGGRCVIKYADRTADVQPGDRFLTSGLDGIFPAGHLVAVCTDVAAGTGEPHKWVEAEAACDPWRVEDATILLPVEDP